MTNSISEHALDEEKIRTLVARAQQVQSDPEALPALHTSGVVIVNVAGRRIFGRDDFASAMRAALASPLGNVRTTLAVEDIRFPTPDVAVVSLTKTIYDERPESPDSSEPPMTGALSFVLTREGSDWRIALAQTTHIH